MQIYIKGNYKNNFSRLELQKLENSDVVVVNVHGIYGRSGDKGSKSELLGNKILSEKIGSVVYYSSSRDWNIFDDSDKVLGMKAFEDKTFAQEGQDLADALELITNSSKDLFGVEKVKIYIVANSLGGTITSTVSYKFDNVEKIVVCGSGITPSSRDKPILSTYPYEDEIKNSTMKYKGKFMLLQGSKDETVPVESQNKLMESFTNASSKVKKIIEGANHNFSSIDGENKELAYQKYVNAIVEFLK